MKCITDFPKPTTLTQVLRFLRKLNFYQSFLPKSAHIFAPLVQLLKGPKNRKKSKKSQVCEQNQFDQLIWNEKAFNDAKRAIVYATLLRHPIPRTELNTWLDTSDVAIGVSLM